jgi:hypothetical protein
MEASRLNELKLELSLKAKNGLDFIISAIMIWSAISYIWTLSSTTYNKSILTFIVGGLMLPFAFGLSKILKTQWKVESNPLQPLGLIFNFTQLFYFPFLIFVLLRSPDYFVMTYAIITGAHFFPYSWYYNEKGYAVMAGLISMGALLIALNASPEKMFLVAAFVSGSLVLLAIWLFVSLRMKTRTQ